MTKSEAPLSTEQDSGVMMLQAGSVNIDGVIYWGEIWIHDMCITMNAVQLYMPVSLSGKKCGKAIQTFAPPCSYMSHHNCRSL